MFKVPRNLANKFIPSTVLYCSRYHKELLHWVEYCAVPINEHSQQSSLRLLDIRDQIRFCSCIAVVQKLGDIIGDIGSTIAQRHLATVVLANWACVLPTLKFFFFNNFFLLAFVINSIQIVGTFSSDKSPTKT